jgi:NADPH-dependent 2,4-dienoyl-CoA reductase/sulfur reductase-like enzyme
LSKDVLLGTAADPLLPVEWAGLDVDVRTGATARELICDDGTWVVRVEGGDNLRADRVVVATGARPVRLPGFAAHPYVFTLRTLDDAHGLRAVLRRGLDVVVVGAGWIGAEVASSTASIGCAVRVVEPGETPLPSALDAAVGKSLVPWYHEAGVDLILGRRVVGAGDRDVELDDGGRLPADVVVVGVGVVPATDWLTGSTVKLDDRGAVVVDEFLESVSARGIYAIGDCASYPSRRYETRLRPEHWTNAQQSGLAVAATALGGSTAYDPVPYFWSKQFGNILQYVGHHLPGDQLVWRGDPANRAWTTCWLRNGQPTALLAVNRPRDVMDARRLLAERATFDLSLLADELTPIARCVQERSPKTAALRSSQARNRS